MRTVCLATLLLALACSSSAPPRTQYLLRSEPSERAGRVESPVVVGLGRVVIAQYLDQSGIVVQTDTGTVSAARLHEWAEPIEAGVRYTLRESIGESLGYPLRERPGGPAWEYTVDVRIDQLHGTMDGRALLDAAYRITPTAGKPVAFQFTRSAPLPREGYAGLVEAEIALVRQLGAAIAESLREVRAGRS